MSKPIAVLYLPENISDSGERSSWNICNKISESFDEKYTDYYWFCFPDHDAERVEMKVFHPKDFTEIEHAELKKLVEDHMSKFQPTTQTP